MVNNLLNNLSLVLQIGVASGRVVFMGDCQQVMAYIEEVLRITVALPEDDEDRKESLSLLFGAAEMVSKTQRGHFANHVAQFVPPIISVLTSQLQVQVCWVVSIYISCCKQLLQHQTTSQMHDKLS